MFTKIFSLSLEFLSIKRYIIIKTLIINQKKLKKRNVKNDK